MGDSGSRASPLVRDTNKTPSEYSPLKTRQTHVGRVVVEYMLQLKLQSVLDHHLPVVERVNEGVRGTTSGSNV